MNYEWNFKSNFQNGGGSLKEKWPLSGLPGWFCSGHVSPYFTRHLLKTMSKYYQWNVQCRDGSTFRNNWSTMTLSYIIWKHFIAKLLMIKNIYYKMFSFMLSEIIKVWVQSIYSNKSRGCYLWLSDHCLCSKSW